MKLKSEPFDFRKDFGEGDLADAIPVRPFDEEQIRTLKGQLDDLYFDIGAVDAPRGPILMPPTRAMAPQRWNPRGRVIPCDNIIVDDSDGGNGQPPGQGLAPGGLRNGPTIIEIPPGLQNCVFTQHHRADNGDGWVVLVRIQDGRMRQVVVIDENGNRTPVHRNVGRIIKVHKDNDKITVVGTRRSCTYFIKSNRLVCVT